MPCYCPVRARRAPDGSVKLLGSIHEPALLQQAGSFSLPCGRCVGCRLKYSQMWAIRCVHEASLWDVNCCVTLTYADEHLPKFGNLVYRDFQLFLKRLRRSCAPSHVRFFCGGEYGDLGARPHFHSILFNYDFADKVVFKEREGRPVLWTSALLDSLWGLGNCTVGECSFDSAAYVARYVCKKVYGDLAPDHYHFEDHSTGESCDLSPEFAHMSLKPGIGLEWVRRFPQECARELSVYSRGRFVPAPRYYVKYLSTFCDEHVSDVKAAIKKRMASLRSDNTPRRLHTKARVAAARLGLSRRKL